MDNVPKDGLDLEVRSPESLRKEAVTRLEQMIRAVLPKRAPGKWRLDVMNEYKPFQHSSQYHLHIESLGDTPTLLHVAARSTLGVGGAISGTLRIPIGIHRLQLLQAILPVVSDFNRKSWNGVLAIEVRSVMFSTGKSAVKTPPKPSKPTQLVDKSISAPAVRPASVDGRTAIESERKRFGYEGVEMSSRLVSRPRSTDGASGIHPIVAEKPPVPPKSSVPPPVAPAAPPVPSLPDSTLRDEENAVPTTAPSAPLPSQLAPTSTRKEADMSAQSFDRTKLEQCLVDVLKNASDGVFTGEHIARAVKSSFPDHPPKGLAGRVLLTWEGSRWTRRVAPSTFQVEQSFLDTHQEEIGGITLVVREKLHRAKPKPRASAKMNDAEAPVAGPAPAKQVDPIKFLMAKRVALEQDVVAAQEALRSFDEELRTQLGPLAEKLYPDKFKTSD